MSKDTTCLHCCKPLDPEHRAVRVWFANHWLHGRACKACWNGTLLGSLLYQAEVCHKEPCECGWCAELRARKEHEAGKSAAG